VLAKLLLYGETVDALNLYEWKQDTIRNLPCDLSSYLNLIQLCYKENVTATFASSFVRSICLYDILKTPIPSKKLENIPEIIENLDREKCKELIGFQIEDNLLINKLAHQNTNEAITVLATLTPFTLEIKVEFFKEQLKESKKATDIDLSKSTDVDLSKLNRILAEYGKTKIEPNNPEVVSALLKALKDENWMVRKEAIKLLGQIKPNNPEVVSALLEALQDNYLNVRGEAAIALRQIKPNNPEVVSALLEALKDKYETVRIAAGKALSELS
jgi:HEAT repeat protein